MMLLDPRFQTPGINPGAPDPRTTLANNSSQGQNSVFGKIDQYLNNPGGGFLLNLLAQSGKSLTPGPGPIGAIGRAALATQQQNQQRGFADLQRQMLESQIGLNNARAENPFQNNAKPPASIAEYNLYSQQAREAGEKPVSFKEWREQTAAGRVVDVNGAKWVVSSIPGVPPVRLSTTESEIEAAGERKRVEQTASSEAQRDVRESTELPEIIAKDQEFIDKSERFIEIIENNELNTGPLVGLLPALSTNAQLFDAFSGENIIKGISDATFGSLSEGERDFIRSTNPNRSLTEEANIDIMKTKVQYIKNAQERYKRRLSKGQAGEGVVIDFSELPD